MHCRAASCDLLQCVVVRLLPDPAGVGCSRHFVDGWQQLTKPLLCCYMQGVRTTPLALTQPRNRCGLLSILAPCCQSQASQHQHSNVQHTHTAECRGRLVAAAATCHIAMVDVLQSLATDPVLVSLLRAPLLFLCCLFSAPAVAGDCRPVQGQGPHALL